MNPVFVDTGPWVALVNGDNPRHDEAVGRFGALSEARRPLVTSDYVLDESVTQLREECGLVVALRFLVATDEAQAARRLRLLWVDQRIHEEAWRLLQAQRVLPLTFTDATTAVLARQARVQAVLTFDPSFTAMGFPAPAAEPTPA
jgi:predicted nucleic acid-binding protein